MTVLIPFAGLSPVPWKNGGGSTIEIAIGPPDAGFEDFDWRVSLATIAEDGAFSQFRGVDRTLALVEGHGMTLHIDGQAMLISEADPVASFDGASLVQAKLSRGPTTDYNVMTRSDLCYHQFGRRILSGDSTFVARADVTVLFLAEGDSLELASDDERIGMVRYDAVLLDPDTVWSLEAGQATIFIVDVYYHADEDEEEAYE
ncbi:HutD/Ves family protein [Massilia niastensis]|uniref:HutD/Ves family protein n=1 Tax=Massilia niastensis TaxID=544911 RepID=UPI00037006FB|nr:HutD family protein [Massilia niastensis]